jgi:hypothetical protein
MEDVEDGRCEIGQMFGWKGDTFLCIMSIFADAIFHIFQLFKNLIILINRPEDFR